jgi:hypothetical protein
VNKQSIYTASIEKLALYKHLTIYICKNITYTSINGSNLFLTSSLPLTQKAVKNNSTIIKSQKNHQLKPLPHKCEIY